MRPTDPIQISQVEDFPTAAFAACDFSFDISQAIAIPYDDPRQLHPVPSRRKDYGGDPADWDGATSGWKALFIARSNDHVVGYAMMSEYRSEEHTSEIQSLMRISYAVFCLKKKKTNTHIQ